MRRLGAIILGLSSLLVLALKVAFMLLALLLVTIDEQLNKLEQWMSVRAAMLAGTAIPVFEDEDYGTNDVGGCPLCEEERRKISTPKE